MYGNASGEFTDEKFEKSSYQIDRIPYLSRQWNNFSQIFWAQKITKANLKSKPRISLHERSGVEERSGIFQELQRN